MSFQPPFHVCVCTEGDSGAFFFFLQKQDQTIHSVLKPAVKIFWSIVYLQCCHFCCTAKWLPFTYVYIFHVLFLYGLSQDIEYSALYSTVGPYCFSIWNPLVCTCESQTPNTSIPPASPPWQPQFCSLCLWVCAASILYSIFSSYWFYNIVLLPCCIIVHCCCSMH